MILFSAFNKVKTLILKTSIGLECENSILLHCENVLR